MSAGKCRRHPRQVVVGVCAACLKERLLALMIEEEEFEIARNSFASSSSVEASTCMQDSPPMYIVPGGHAFAHSSSGSSFNIFTDHCKASTVATSASAPRRLGMEYNREDVKHVASLYLQRHHSLSSSPLQKPTNLKASSPLPSSLHDHGDDREGRRSSVAPAICRDQRAEYKAAEWKADDHVVAASIPRKKRGSLWSLLQRHGVESGSSSMRKPDCNKSGEQPRRLSLQGNSTLLKSAYMNMPGHISDDGRQHKALSHNASSNLHSNALDRSGKVNASNLSLDNSPRSLQSTHASGTSSMHMLSPAPSRHCTPLISPLHMKDELSRHAEIKLLQGRRHSFADDSVYDIADIDHEKPSKSNYHGSASDGSKSWISALFNPSRGKSSKSLLSKANDARVYAMSHNPSRRQSMSASPEMAPRRKSVSFLDEHVASRSPRTTSRFKTSPPKNLDHDRMKMRGPIGVQHPKACSSSLLAAGMHDTHGFTGENGLTAGENVRVIEHGDRRGAYHLDIVGNQDQQNKSPRMRMASFLTKRRNSMGSAMDCTRDMRVSPAPMLSTSAEIRNPASRHIPLHRNLPLMIEEGDEDGGENYGSLHTSTLWKSVQQHDDGRRRSSMIRLVPASMLDAEVHQDVKKISNIEEKKKTMDDGNGTYNSMSKSKSWSSTWSKTLSPMLGLRGSKKKRSSKQKIKETCSSSSTGIESLKQTSINADSYDQASSKIMNNNNNNIGMVHSSSLQISQTACNNLHHQDLQHSNFDHNLLITSNCGAAGVPCIDPCCRPAHLVGQVDSDSYSSTPASVLRKDNYNALCRSEGLNNNVELRTPKLSPSSMFSPNQYIKRPPQQYSFLSKDYSAFSFYFSPRSSSSSNSNQMISDQLRRLTAEAGTPPRHSVDGTFPSLLRKQPPPAAAPALLALAPNGR